MYSQNPQAWDEYSINQNPQAWNEYSINQNPQLYSVSINPSIPNTYHQSPSIPINYANYSEYELLNNFGIKLKKTKESKSLSEAINFSQIIDVRKNIQALMKKKIKVKIRLVGMLTTCDIHALESNKFKIEEIFVACFCNYGHKYCFGCISNYVKNMFTSLGVGNYYECMCCTYSGIEGTKLLTDEQLTYVLYQTFGVDYMTQLLTYTPIERPCDTITLQILCNICNTNNSQIFTLCISGHKICLYCIKNWINNIGNNALNCPITTCKGFINIQVLIKNLAGTNILFKIKNQLLKLGFKVSFCFNCRYYLELSKDTKTICGHCRKKICSNCEKEWHFGLTCFYFVSQQDFEVIKLPKPSDPLHPKSLLEQEYLNAKYAFDNFVNPGNRQVFNRAKLIVNKPLEERYSAKKKEMSKQCGGQSKVNEIYAWHGSRCKNYDVIMKDGLKVGGVDDGVPIAVGAVYGHGVYSASTPNTPITYAKDSKWVLACLAMKGRKSSVEKTDISTLNDGRTHSFETNGDWVIFFTKEQLLPRFLIEYKNI